MADMQVQVNVLTEPIAEAITIVLHPSRSHKPWRVARQRLKTALRVSLHISVRGWRVRRVPYATEIIYDLLPPEGYSLSVDDAWNLTYTLASLPDIEDAEPAFRVLQDAVVPDGVERDALPVAAASAAPDDFEPCHDDDAPATVDPNLVDWSALLVDAQCAWIVPPPTHDPPYGSGRTRGEGTRIGHPDAGYRAHTDYLTEPAGESTRVLHALERDFVDGHTPVDPRPAQNPDGQHGLSTGTVIMSSDLTGDITGIAPAADIVPLRVTKPRGFIPSPILFDSGVRALRDGIGYAVHDAGCHVISISLGWFSNRSLHAAVRDAEANNVIVCAAAGNYTPFVIWPAAYAEVIAVGGCNATRHGWPGSARGRAVGISGPSEDVWVASFTRVGLEAPAQSSGTSFGVATVAGVAALWLAFHNRDYLLDRYQGQFTLTDVFRYILGLSSDPFADAVSSIGLGVGIVNARKTLKTPLPTIAQLQQQTPALAQAPLPDTPFNRVAAAFPDVEETRSEQWLAETLRVEADGLNEALDGVEDEIIFQIATDARLRSELTGIAPAAAPGLDGGPVPQAAPQPSTATLATNPLSDRLRSRVRQ